MEPYRTEELFGVATPVIGMVHLLPLPGAPGAGADRSEIQDRMLRDLEALAAGGRGVDGILLENFGDAPFHPERVPGHVIATMSALAATARRRTDLPLGVNVLRNDARAALSVADAVGADFIRVNVWIGARVTDQGILQGRAHEVLRLRHSLGSGVRVFADVDVKHSAPLGDRTPSAEAREAAERGAADALVVTGPATGALPEATRLEAIREAVPGVPVLVGSGMTPEAAAGTVGRCDGMVVGSALERGGRAGRPVEEERVRRFMGAVRDARPRA